MADPIDTGGPAFPPLHDPRNHESGMTLLDYYAGEALPGAIESWRGTNPDDESCIDLGSAAMEDLCLIAETAFEMAEAMLIERKKRYG